MRFQEKTSVTESWGFWLKPGKATNIIFRAFRVQKNGMESFIKSKLRCAYDEMRMTKT